MKRKTWTVSEKLAILDEATQGDIVETCRKYGVSSATYYNWRKKFESRGEAGLKPQYNIDSNVELKKAEEENRLLRKLLADKEIELEIQKELLKKKFGTDDPRKI